MRHLIPAVLLGLSIGSGTALPAQQQPDWVSQLITAARLPVAASEARREGVADTDIRSVLDAMRRDRVPAHEAAALIDTARAVQREHGPVDNFGAFVQAQLASGKRGRELAAAIRAEHARAGRGSAARGNQGRGQGQARDTARGNQGRGQGQARDTVRTPGRPADRGARPADKPNPKPDDRGRGNPNRPNP